MAVCYDETTLERTTCATPPRSRRSHPVLLDRFLEDAVELDLDLLADGKDAVVVRHPAAHRGGGHPLRRLGGGAAAVAASTPAQLDEMRDIARRLALRLGVVGLMNIQFALHDGKVYVLEVNPRASRTVPFIAKAVGLPLVGMAAAGDGGQDARRDRLHRGAARCRGVFVKAPVFPFNRFPGVDPLLGPEMKSTGEVMGIGETSATPSPRPGSPPATACRSRAPRSSRCTTATSAPLVPVALRLAELGFELVATDGTAAATCARRARRRDGAQGPRGAPARRRPLINREIHLVVNTPLGRDAQRRRRAIRRAALQHDVPCITTLSGALAAAEGIAALRRGTLDVRSLQEIHREVAVRA